MKKLLFMPLVCISMLSLAQTITVRDNSTREPVENVSIKDRNNVVAVTDIRGKVDITSLDKSDTLIVLHLSYNTKKIILGNNTKEISIVSKIIMLDEIIFSANKTKEKNRCALYHGGY